MADHYTFEESQSRMYESFIFTNIPCEDMRIHDKPSSQWKGRPEVEYEKPRGRKVKRKKNVGASIIHLLHRRLRGGLDDWYYRLVLMRSERGKLLPWE